MDAHKVNIAQKIEAATHRLSSMIEAAKREVTDAELEDLCRADNCLTTVLQIAQRLRVRNS